jgi:hypothetical protein
LVDLHVKLGLELLSLKEVRNEWTSVSNSVVSGVVGCRPDGKLKETQEEDNLGNSGKRDGEKSVHAIRNIRETESQFLGEVSWELNVGVVEKHTDNGSHGNTSVLALDGTTTLEASVESGKVSGRVLGRIQPSKRIVESKRGGDSDGWIKRVDALLKGRRSLLKEL